MQRPTLLRGLRSAASQGEVAWRRTARDVDSVRRKAGRYGRWRKPDLASGPAPHCNRALFTQPMPRGIIYLEAR